MLLKEENCGNEDLTSAERDSNSDWRRKIEAREQLWPLTFNCVTEARIHSDGSVAISALGNGKGDTQIYLECTATTSWAYKAQSSDPTPLGEVLNLHTSQQQCLFFLFIKIKQNHPLVADWSVGQQWKHRPIKTPAPDDITTSGIQQSLLQ